MGASVKKPLLWVLVLLICYPLGCGVFVATCRVADSITAKDADGLLARIHSGMTPAEVEAVIGRPSEHTVLYPRVRDVEQFSHNWTIRGHRLEAIFVNSRSEQWHTFRPNPNRVQRFFGWVFFWWLAPFVED
jgi:hypothetical protein